MKRTTILAMIATLALVGAPYAPAAGPGGPGHGFGPGGPGGPGPGGPGDRPFAEHLFPPELVLAHQTELGLTEQQLDTIKQALNRTHAEALDLQIQLQRVGEQLGKVLEPAHVDAEQALELAKQAMGLEARIKATHLRLAIEVKNTLTPEQQEKLREMRPERRGHRPGPPRD